MSKCLNFPAINLEINTCCPIPESIKVDIDRSQDVVKLEVLNAGKDLYISTGRDTTALYAKINCTADQDIETKKKAILVQYLSEYGTEIGMCYEEALLNVRKR